MCYYYSVPNMKLLETRFHAKYQGEVKFDRLYHISGFTTPQLPVITNKNPNQIQLFAWGLIPHWIEDEINANKIQTRLLNARAETIHKKPAFRNLTSTNRSLVLADGFFEWRHYQGRAYPYYITLKNNQPFAFAGLWNQWTSPITNQIRKSYTIITTYANPLLEQVHNKRKRMPVVLHASDEQAWLRQALSLESINDLLTPYPANQMQVHPVSRFIASKGVKSNSPEATKPKEYPELPAITVE